jgi:DNA mismatch repair protein MutS2
LHVEGAPLDTLALLQMARLCEQAMAARAAIFDERETAPMLWQLVETLPRDLNSVVARITNKILPDGELDDRASPELAGIRHEITTLRSRITRSLERVMHRSAEAIQDELVTMRNDRFVIPVKADHRGRVAGVAHGYSSSGATAFVEPLETIDANNELQGLREAEAREIARILFALTEELRTQLPAIEMAAAAVAELDFVNAKALFHHRFKCAIPEIDPPPASLLSSGRLELVEARHPLLEENLRGTGGEVVPVSFALDDEKNAMVISGANAGGKTVVLKTTDCSRSPRYRGFQSLQNRLAYRFTRPCLPTSATINRSPRTCRRLRRTWRTSRACSNPAKRPRSCYSTKSAREPIRKRVRHSASPWWTTSGALAPRT